MIKIILKVVLTFGVEYTNKLTLTLITIISASLFLIPVIGIFVYILQFLMFTHFNLKRLQSLR